MINVEGKLAQERIKQAGDDERLAAKIEADAESDIIKAASDFMTSQQPDKNLTASIDVNDVVPPAPGPVSVDQAEIGQSIQDLGEFNQ